MRSPGSGRAVPYPGLCGTTFRNYTGIAFRKTRDMDGMPKPSTERQRRQRVDAQRNLGALLEAAKTAFATSGVDAPAKEIAALAGVGVGTLSRHFPRRSDLVVAVLQREIDACADAGPALSATHEPATALAQ